MIEAAVVATTSLAENQALPAWANQTPQAQDLATFDINMNSQQVIDQSPKTMIVNFEPATAIQSNHDYSTGYYVDAPANTGNDISSQIIKQFASIDAKYQTLFNNENSLSTISGVGHDSATTRTDGAYGVTDAATLMKNFQASVALQTEISVWSAQVNLLTSGISKSTQGIQTLFKNSG